MVDSPLLTKSKAFALEIIRVCNEIKRILISSINTAKKISEINSKNIFLIRVLYSKTSNEYYAVFHLNCSL